MELGEGLRNGWRDDRVRRFGRIFGICLAVRVAAGALGEILDNGFCAPWMAVQRQLHPAVWITWLILAAILYRDGRKG